MKITTVTTTLEGTPEELAVYQNAQSSGLKALMQPEVGLENASVASEQYEVDDGGLKFIKADVARKVLNRRPLSHEQKKVLKAIYAAHPRKLPSQELQELTKYSSRQLAGMMGAFGRRVSHTPGFMEGENLFDWVWTEDGWHYGLPDSVREAMEAEKLV